MRVKKMDKETLVRVCAFAAFQAFNLFSVIYFTVKLIRGTGLVTQLLYSFASVLFVCVPDIAQRLFKFRIATPMYIFILAYAVCPLLGHSYDFYYNVLWWDKLLHITGGVVFALFGAYLPKLITKDESCNMWICIFFGVCFSVSVAVLWEFFEFAMDTFFHTDMQKDTLVSSVYSYKFNEAIGGKLSTILNIEEVVTVVNGEYVIDGYIDLGRIDSMLDLLVETLGALVYAVAYAIDKGVHTSFHMLADKKAESVDKPSEAEEEAAVSE
ncbi:MAG: hypothetical protein IJ514_05080 [Clostridia bacterium]|nr:hypothetical protein [Clostridia bacterium]